MKSAWRFADSQDTVVVTLERILRDDSSLLLVTYDAEDGGWQFLDGDHVFEEDGVTVLLGEMVQFDQVLNQQDVFFEVASGRLKLPIVSEAYIDLLRNHA